MSFEDLVRELTGAPMEEKPFDYQAALKMVQQWMPAPEKDYLVCPTEVYDRLRRTIVAPDHITEEGFQYLVIASTPVLCWPEIAKPKMVTQVEVWQREWRRVSDKLVRAQDKIRMLESQIMHLHDVIDGVEPEVEPPESETLPISEE
jgi:hypothetical protein